MIPKDPFMLLSYVNTQLRDFYSSPEILCEDKNIDFEKLTEKLRSVGYEYDSGTNQYC